MSQVLWRNPRLNHPSCTREQSLFVDLENLVKSRDILAEYADSDANAAYDGFRRVSFPLGQDAPGVFYTAGKWSLLVPNASFVETFGVVT